MGWANCGVRRLLGDNEAADKCAPDYLKDGEAAGRPYFSGRTGGSRSDWR